MRYSVLPLALVLAAVLPARAQVPVTFHVDPENDALDELYVSGTFNGWHPAHPDYRLLDPDGDGYFEATVALPLGEHFYDFAVPNSAWLSDVDNPDRPYGSSRVVVADPMVTYLLPRDGRTDVRYDEPIEVIFAFSGGRPLDPASLRLRVNGVPVPDAAAYYDAVRRTLTYAPPTALGQGAHTVEVSAASSAGSASRTTTFRTAPAIRLHTEDIVYRKADIVAYGEINDPALTHVRVTLNGGPATVVPVVDGRFQHPVTLADGANVVRAEALDGTVAVDQTLRLERFLAPRVELVGGVSEREVRLHVTDAFVASPPLAVVWTEAAGNPAPLGVAGQTGTAVAFTAPEAPGEYYLGATVTDADGRAFTARRYVDVRGDGSVALDALGGHADWVDRMTLYEVNLNIFSESRDFDGLRARLDEVAEVGANAIYLMPVIEANSVDGYQPLDHLAVRPAYGTEADFRALVEAAHARGIRVILDLVYNHTSDQHAFFRNARALGAASPFATYHRWLGEPGASAHEYAIAPAMPNLNLEDPELREWLIRAAEYWVETFGIDGFRADVGWAVQRRSPAFWSELRRRLRAIRPDFFMVVEAFPPLDVYADERFDSAYDHDLRGYGYEDEDALTRALAGTGSLDALDAVVRHRYPEGFLPYRFAETHDSHRIPREFDVARSRLAHALVFTIGGIPNVWAGAEYGEDAPLYNSEAVVDRSDPHGLRPFFRRLGEIRRAYFANDATVVRLPNTASAAVYAYAAQSELETGLHTVMTALNFSAQPQTLTVDLRSVPTPTVTDLLNGGTRPLGQGETAAFPLALGPYEAAVFSLDAAPPVVGGAPPPSDRAFRLAQSVPNPVHGRASIEFELPSRSHARLCVYDVLGRQVAVLADGPFSAGVHRVWFDGAGYASGPYFYRLEAGAAMATGRMMVLN